MSGEKITDALLGRLGTLTFSPTIPVAWPNISFTPPAGPYLAPSIFRNVTQNTAFRTDVLRGIFQVSAFYPLNQGPLPAEKTADAIVAHFNRGLWISSEGVTVRIRNSWAASPMKDGTRWHVPVSIDWFCQINT